MPKKVLGSNDKSKSNSVTKVKKRVAKPKNSVKAYAAQHLWSTKDKIALLEGIKKHGFENLDEVEKMIGTKDQNEIRFFIENRRIALMRKLKHEEARKPDEQKRALVELWDQKLTSEVQCRYRANDCSSCIAEIFNHASEKESHLQPENDLEPDISAVYRFFGKVISGIFPSDLRPIDSMLVLYLVQSLRDILTADELEVERDLYSKFQGSKGNVNFLTEQLPHSSGVKQEIDPWEPYREKNPDIVKMSKEYRRLLQYFNPLYVPPSLLCEETELLRGHIFDSVQD